MQITDILARKRDGHPLSDGEISHFVQSYARDELPDYQAAAFLMAVFLRGMSSAETTALTLAMAASGAQLDWSDLLPYAVDKHSSGGLGDTTTLVVLPLVAACGVPVVKMSGRGLGHSGGTLDKIEAISGFRHQLSETEMRAQVEDIGLALAGQSAALAPADGKFYALRDVTATVNSIPLIAASIMSKKLAGGAQGIVLDVKVGSGAFTAELPEARQLAREMVAVGRAAGRDMVALIADMNQPLGRAVGNALEVAEACRTLCHNPPTRLREHCLIVASAMLQLARAADPQIGTSRPQEARRELEARLADGSAFAKFQQLVAAQGGDPRQLEDMHRLPQPRLQEVIPAHRSGYLNAIDATVLGRACTALGAGRLRKEDEIDPAVGLVMRAELGDALERGAPLLTIYANDEGRLAAARHLLAGGEGSASRQGDARRLSPFRIDEERCEPPPLIHETIADEAGNSATGNATQ